MAKLIAFTELTDAQGKPVTDPTSLAHSRCLALLACVEGFFQACHDGAQKGEGEDFVRMQTFVLTLNLSNSVEFDLPRLKRDIETLAKTLGFDLLPPLTLPGPMSKEIH